LLQGRVVEDATAGSAALATHEVSFGEALDVRKVPDVNDSLRRLGSGRGSESRCIVW
jgi:hypothetical protein